MSENKGVNRIFLLTVVLYVGMSFALSFLSVLFLHSRTCPIILPS